MSTEPASWILRLEAVADRFIPPSIVQGPAEDARRARFAVALAWVSAGFFVIAMLVQGPVNSRALLVLNALSAILCLAAPFLLRRFGRPALICNGVLAVAFCKYVSLAVLLRGAGLSGATVLLAQLPLVATFLVGLRAGAVWAVLSIASGVTIGLLGRAGIVDHLPATQRLINDHFVLAVSTALLLAIAALYERTKDAAQRHIYDLEARRRTVELERISALSKLQLAEAEQLASLGRVAAATAHEINNPLAAVVANLELAASSPPNPAPGDLSSTLTDALAAAHRIRHIVADMGMCSQLPSGTLGPVSVAHAVELAIRMAGPFIRTRAPIHTRIDEALPSVVAETARLAQVLLNLLVNAAQAIPEGQAEHNEIVVEARAAEGRVIVEVRDTGCGIPPELVSRVREPFFTTKTIGEGKGLGLALCEGSMRSFGGSMTIESRPGRTIVGLHLVAAPARPSEAAQRAEVKRSDAGSARNILIVDDDVGVSRSLTRVLRGHVLTVANGGQQALKLLLGENRFELVFCDLMMPDLSGIDVFERLQASNPGLAARMVFMTGGTFTERAQKFRASVANTFLEKPFDQEQICDIVRDCVALRPFDTDPAKVN